MSESELDAIGSTHSHRFVTSRPASATANLANTTTDSRWTQILPPFELTKGGTSRFLTLLVLSTIAVYFVVSWTSGAREGLPAVLAYLFVFPGVLGLGWFFFWMFCVGSVFKRNHRRILSDAQSAFEEQARRFGDVRYMDVSLDAGQFTGLALVGATLLVVQNGQMRTFSRADIRSWRWEVTSPSQLIVGSDAVSRLELRGKEQQALEKVNGFYVMTYDPLSPELHLRTSSAEICRRWEVILQNVTEGRTAVD